MQKFRFSLTLLLAALLFTATSSMAQTRRLGPKARAAITIGSGTAIGAGVGALIKGKKGAAIGALLGGGGTAAAYLLKTRRNNDNRYYSRSNHSNGSYARRTAYNNGRGNGRRCRR